MNCVMFLGRDPFNCRLRLLVLLILLGFFTAPPAMSQSGYTLWGDRLVEVPAEHPLRRRD